MQLSFVYTSIFPLLFLWLGLQNVVDGSWDDPVFLTRTGEVSFLSDADLERIEASSDRLMGVIDLADGAFAFKVNIASFVGFNSPLQREHFNENYLESDKFSSATFEGSIIERINFKKEGEYAVRAKGILTIHGIAQERIIKSIISISPHSIEVRADFSVILSEHDISIPKIVHQKIAEEIEIAVKATLEK